MKKPISTSGSGLDHARGGLPPLRRVIQLSFEHRVYFTERVFDLENALLKDLLLEGHNRRVPKILVLVDESLHGGQPDFTRSAEMYFRRLEGRIQLVCPPLVIEGGERLKNSYFHVSQIQSEIDRFHIDRHSYVLAAGGGALLDVAGLAAATAHRGVRHIRIPSTTLSQDDSGVGIKNGINAFGKKNFIGTFAVPFAVINDFSLLESLSPRDRRGGYSEAVKVACIRDREYFAALEQDAGLLRAFDRAALRRLIYRSAELHVNHIATSGDPFELGSARPLDFGHWAAHKLEQLSEYRIRHGEAVAIGIALDVVYSRLMGFLDPDAAERILRLLEALGFELFANELLHVDSHGELMILRGLEEFRLHLGGELTVTLLRDIGDAFEAHEMKNTKVAAAMRELQRRAEMSTTLTPAPAPRSDSSTPLAPARGRRACGQSRL